MRPRIGIAPCIVHGVGRGNTTFYAEDATVAWVRSGGAVPLVLPPPGDAVSADDVIEGLDGLLLHGGVDVAPQSYGDVPIKDAWKGDATRDGYELALVQAALNRDLPIFGICRGMQLLNVARGGTLLQDILERRPGSQPHINGEDLDFAHAITIAADSWLAGWYGAVHGRVNSIHHQALDRLGDGVIVEARADDGVVEAIRVDGTKAYAVQWHPEYMHGTAHGGLDPAVLLNAFLEKTRWRS